MAGISIREAAQLQGVAQDTIRRRIRRGELKAHQEPTPQGFRWIVELEEETAQAEPPQVQGHGMATPRQGRPRFSGSWWRPSVPRSRARGRSWRPGGGRSQNSTSSFSKRRSRPREVTRGGGAYGQATPWLRRN